MISPRQPDPDRQSRGASDNTAAFERRSRRGFKSVRWEEAMKDWYGDHWAANEIEARQVPSDSAGDVLDEIFAELNKDEHLALRRVVNNWPSFTGEKIATVTAPLRIKDKILFIEVSDPAWRFTLEDYGTKKRITDALHEFCPNIIDGIKFVPAGRTRNFRR